MKFDPTPQQKKFKLELVAYYGSESDLLLKLDKIKTQILHGRHNYNDVLLKYDVITVVEPYFRYEEINGYDCIVYQSKMNEEI